MKMNLKNLLEKCEERSVIIPDVHDLYQTNDEIKWYANEIGEFEDEKISNFYLKNHYARLSRWNLWQSILVIFEKYKVKSNLDIGCANNHFSYICIKSGIDSIGIEPRKILVDQNNQNFSRLGINDKHCYQGNIKCLNQVFEDANEVILDCVSVINFLHASNQDEQEVLKMIEIFSKISKYAILSVPYSKNASAFLNEKFLNLETTADGNPPHIFLKNRSLI